METNLEINNIMYQFVAVCDNKTKLRVDLGLVVGFVFGQPYGIRAKVYSLSCQKMKVVSLDDCIFMPKAGIVTPATVHGLFAWQEQFGQGAIFAERQQGQKMMEVRLQNPAGSASGWLALDGVTLLGPKP